MYCLIDICDLKDYCNKLFFKINYLKNKKIKDRFLYPLRDE